MSKRALKKYLSTLTKAQLEEQLLDVYGRFKNVKTYYDFVFNPKEEKITQEAKAKIKHEYFPLTRRKPRMRRSVAQKLIKHFLNLGVDPYLIADLMLFNIETAQRYTLKKNISQDSFYKSIYNSFIEVKSYVVFNGVEADFNERIQQVVDHVIMQDWINVDLFKEALE
jgi:hypothetical protein